MPSPVVNLETVGTWLADNTGFIKGGNLQVQFATQDAPGRCVTITNNGGAKPYMDPPRTRIDWMLQVLSRAPDWGDAHDDSGIFYKFLYEDGTSHVGLPVGAPTFRIEFITCTGAPQYIGRDDAGRFQFSANYNLKIFKL